jgi:sugar phosphate isomerase/epimerase
MVDGEGMMGHPDKAMRRKAAENHYKWVDIAAELGCHSIRTNMYPGEKQPASGADIAAFLDHCGESFTALCNHAAPRKINVIIENHGGVSSNPDVVVRLMKMVQLPNFGTLPDFGNFPKEMDKYEAVRKLMPYAKGVSLKCYDFGPDGNETSMDLHRMMKIADEAGYRGWVGIEYEGSRLTEFEGIAAAKRFLDKY